MRLKKLSARSGYEPANHKHEACHATSSTIWVACYGLRKAQIMYNCGSRLNDVNQRSPSICDSATSRGPRDTSSKKWPLFLYCNNDTFLISWFVTPPGQHSPVNNI